MRLLDDHRRTLNTCLAAALIFAQIVGYLALPKPVAAAVSADPNAELVYLDENGVIRVLDTQGDPLVQWFSPDNGWDNIALADVNDDGDMEIVALDRQGEENLRIRVYDPVVTSGATNPDQQINGIPWDLLWETSFGGNGQYIVAGNFDQNIPGDEFAVGFRNGDTSVIIIYNAASLDPRQKPTGRDWKRHIEKEYPEYEYTFGISGQLNGEGADELIVFDPESATTRMDIYRPDNDLALLDSESSDNDRFKYGAAGQLREGGQEELVAILTVDRPTKTSVRAYEMGDTELEEDEGWAFAPQPDWVFLADIEGNDDDEIFFLRNYPEGDEGARLIMRDHWGDDANRNEDLIEWALMDDGAENQFRAGAGADIDGDGRDEVILMRDDRIRIYHEPRNGREESADYTDYMVNTDNSRNNLLAGDLDRTPIQVGPVLLVDKSLIEAIVPAGTMSTEQTLLVTNVGSAEGVGISAVIPASSGWAQANPTFATTPATFRIRFDARNLTPGVYRTTLTLRANRADVINDNWVVPLNLTVVPPTLQPNPPLLSLYRLPEDHDNSDPFTTTVRIRGSNDLNFRAAIVGVPDATQASAAGGAGLAGPITGAEIADNGNIIVYDDQGNSRTLGADQVHAASTDATMLLLDPDIPWITGATLSSESTPANLAIGINPAIMTEDYQREHAVLVLVADTRAGTPQSNVTIVPIELANVGDLLWVTIIAKD